MAWDDFEINGQTVWTGDKPIDEFTLALQKIVKAYEEEFSRKPTSLELATTLEQVIGTDPASYVSDFEGLKNLRVLIQRE